ncbi:MAG: hypothetical protein JXA42_04620 [Anaerolineales bacterium]|nr:hypothetical protein [Anaerolineales bacterium]
MANEMEQRVKALEYDIKLTKDDIQRMLLDIQEQLLVHRFPTLRKASTTPPEGVVQSLQEIRRRKKELSRK